MSLWRRPRRESPLHVAQRGQGGSTLVFLPGLGATTRYWDGRTEALEGRYKVVFVDLLGFGRSPKPWTRYSVSHHLAALNSALTRNAPFWLIGHSLGALLALAYAARHPDQVRGLVLIGMPLFESRDAAYRYFRGGAIRGGWLMTNLALTIVACIVTRRLFGRVLPYLLRDIPRPVAQDLVKHTWRSSSSSLWEVIYRHNAYADLAALPQELCVLCIHGEKDVVAPIGPIRELTDRLPGWELGSLPGVDHHPFLRRPERCQSVIEGFIESQSPAACSEPQASSVLNKQRSRSQR